MQVTQSGKMERIYFVDLLESIAIFLVLSYHGTNYSCDFLQDSDNILYYARYFLRTILSCCVPLFFFVNGYLLLNRKFDLKKHILKIVRLIILTVIWGIIDLFILMFVRNEFLSVKEFLMGVWSCKQGWINHLWYMQALIVIYFAFPLIKTAYDNKREVFYFFAITATIFTFGNVFVNIAASIGVHLLLGKNSFYTYNWFGDFNPFRGIFGYSFVYFCVGGIANDLLNKLKILNKAWVCMTSVVVSMLVLSTTGIMLSRISGTQWDVVWSGYNTSYFAD